MIISVDTEEDNWVPTRTGVTVRNIGELPRFQDVCARVGARPTYFTSYQVVRHAPSRRIMRELHAGGGCEVASHLHPWNTPPFRREYLGRNTMLRNLPTDLQGAKLEGLSQRLEDLLGVQPTSFRTGRFGLGPDTVALLVERGYRVDSSVTPYWSWQEYDDGPDWDGAPMRPYRVAPYQDPRTPAPDGPLIELPVSVGFSRRPFDVWARVYRRLRSAPLSALHASGIASRLGVVRRIILSPEVHGSDDLLVLSRRMVESGVPYLNLILHSSSLLPGLSPFTPTAADVQTLLRRIEQFAEGLAAFTTPRFVTVGEAAELLDPLTAPAPTRQPVFVPSGANLRPKEILCVE